MEKAVSFRGGEQKGQKAGKSFYQAIDTEYRYLVYVQPYNSRRSET